MGEFEIFKKALERTGAKLYIINLIFDDGHTEDLLEDLTHRITYWFTDDQLTDIDNCN